MALDIKKINEAMNSGDFTALNSYMFRAEGAHEDFMVLYSMVLLLHTRVKAQETLIKALEHAMEEDDDE